MIRKLCFAFVAPLALALVLSSCDDKPKTVSKPAAPEKKKPTLSVDARYDAARKLLMEGKFAEAAAGFHELDAEPKIRQPLFNWITTLEGMSLLLDGREKEARPVFAALAARKPFSEKEDDAPMVKFFADIGRAMSSEEAIPATAAKDFDKWTFEGLAFLLFASKDWSLENFDEGVPLFRQFADVQPEKMVAWADGPEDLKMLKDIAQGCVDDYLEGRPALQALTSAKSTEQQQEALEKAKAARAKMKLTTKISREIDAQIAEIGPKVAAVMQEKARVAAEEQASDDKLLPEAKQKRIDLQSKFMFSEARQAMLDPNLKTEKARDEQQLLAKKSQWLSNFKDQLIEDLTKKHYNVGVTTKKSGPISGTINSADAQNVIMTTAKGPLPIAWTDLTPDSIFAMGQSYITPDLPDQIMAFRKWHLGVYASYIGRPESMTLLKEAAALRTLFGEELPVFEKPSNPW